MFSPDNATLKLEISTKDSTGNVMSKDAEAFKRSAQHYGLKPEQLFTTYVYLGSTYKILGLLPKSKNSLLVEKGGKRYKISPRTAGGHEYKWDVSGESRERA